MIKTEHFMTRSDGVELYRTYSDANVKIMQVETGLVYDEAIDIEDSGYTYTETELPVEDI